MEASRFDDLTRRLADPISRRRLARVLGGVAVGGTVSSPFASQPALAVRQSTAVCLEGSPSAGLSTQLLALTFTPDVSGKLSEARVRIYHAFVPAGVGYLIRIVGTDASGKPNLSRVLAKKTIPYDVVEGGEHFLTATFKRRKSAKVEKGKAYAIVVTRTQADANVDAIVRTDNPCMAGTLFHYNSTNQSFVEQQDQDVVFEAFVGY